MNTTLTQILKFLLGCAGENIPMLFPTGMVLHESVGEFVVASDKEHPVAPARNLIVAVLLDTKSIGFDLEYFYAQYGDGIACSNIDSLQYLRTWNQIFSPVLDSSHKDPRG
jgi:hypothetical protein